MIVILLVDRVMVGGYFDGWRNISPMSDSNLVFTPFMLGYRKFVHQSQTDLAHEQHTDTRSPSPAMTNLDFIQVVNHRIKIKPNTQVIIIIWIVLQKNDNELLMMNVFKSFSNS